MAENQRDNGGDTNRSGQDRNQGSPGQNGSAAADGNNRSTVNNPSGETRGKNTADYNPNSPTGQNIPGRDPERNNDPQKRQTPEVPNRGEEHETKAPKAENSNEIYDELDENEDANSK